MSKTWLIFVFMTVSSWGLYGVFLHQGQIAMAGSRAWTLQSIPLCRACLPARSRHRLRADARR